MYRRTSMFVLYGLAIGGLIDSTYLAYSHVTARPLICDIIDGCNIVAASPYSVMMGIPLSFLGIAFYLAILLATWAASTYTHSWTTRQLIGLAAAGVGMSAYFVYLQFFVIGAVCIYCLASALISVLLFGGALWHADTAQTCQRAV